MEGNMLSSSLVLSGEADVCMYVEAFYCMMFLGDYQFFDNLSVQGRMQLLSNVFSGQWALGICETELLCLEALALLREFLL